MPAKKERVLHDEPMPSTNIGAQAEAWAADGPGPLLTITSCPHCDGPLIQHTASGPKYGAWHCNACGCCFLGGQVREGHGICSEGAAREANRGGD